MITVEFTADNMDDLMQQVRYFARFEKLGLPRAGSEPGPSKRGRPKKEEPEPEPEEPSEVAEDDDAEARAADVFASPETSVALHKLKEETLDRLRDLLKTGKGKLVRDLLREHGGGAKVFPEVPAENFPRIKEIMDRELGA